ncbi:MAG: hypothetical protein RR413_03345 [Christensenellaceae bacterium]
MKKALSFIIVLALVITVVFSFGGVALAADNVNLVVKVNPSSLAGPGDTSLYVQVQNGGDPIANVNINYPAPTSSVISLGNIPTGETRDHSNPNWTITEEMFSKDLTFTATFTSQDGTQKSVNATVNIAKKDPVVKVSGSSSAETKTAKSGDKVKFTFKFKNEGNVKIDNAYLKAPPLKGGDQLGDNFSLEPGETVTKTWAEPLTKDTTVNAVITYAVNGTQKTYEFEPVGVKVDAAAAAGGMSVSATADKQTVAAGESVNFTVNVQNTGTSDLKDLVVVDPSGTKLSMSETSLAKGASATGTASVAIAQTSNIAFNATAKDAAGNNINVQSNAVAITTGDAQPTASASAPATVDPKTVMKIDLDLSTNKLQKPGEVDFSIKLVNLSGQELKDVVVSEKTLGVIGTLPTFNTAEESFDKKVMVEETTSYTIMATATMPDGTTIETQTPAFEVKIEKGGSVGGLGTGVVVLIIIICAIVAVAVILGVFIYKNKKHGGNQPRPPYGTSSGKPRQQQGTSRPQGTRPQQSSRPQTSQNVRRPMSRETLEPRPQPRPASKPKSNGSGSYGDRNKF